MNRSRSIWFGLGLWMTLLLVGCDQSAISSAQPTTQEPQPAAKPPAVSGPLPITQGPRPSLLPDTMALTEADYTIFDRVIGSEVFTQAAEALFTAGREVEDLLTGSGPYTFFVPTDTAFAALPPAALEQLLAEPDLVAAILRYGVVAAEVELGGAAVDTAPRTLTTMAGAATLTLQQGAQPTVNGARVVGPMMLAANGLIYPIDALIYPPAVARRLPQTVAGTLAERGTFTRFLALFDIAYVEELLQRAGPMTLLAPTDDAFERLPEATQRALIEEPLFARSLALYHLVVGRQSTADLVGQGAVDSMLGPQAALPATLAVHSRGGAIFVGEARIVTADIRASNGMIHAVDSLLLPALLITDWPALQSSAFCPWRTIPALRGCVCFGCATFGEHSATDGCLEACPPLPLD